MAEEKKEVKEKVEGVFKRFFQNIKTALIWGRGPSSGVGVFRYSGREGADILLDRLTRDKNYERKQVDLISLLKSRVDTLRNIEEFYGQIGYPSSEHPDKKSCYIERIEEKYVELGPHFDNDVLQAEINFFHNGTGREEKEIEITVPGGEAHTFEFDLPATKKLLYPDPEKPERSVAHNMSCFGFEALTDYQKKFNDKIKELIEFAKQQVDASSQFNDDEKALAKRRVQNICDAIFQSIQEYLAEIKEDDKKEADDLKSKSQKIKFIQGEIKEALNRRPAYDLQNIRYWHTFLIVKSQTYDPETNTLRELNPETGEIIRSVLGGDTTSVETEGNVLENGDELIRTDWGEYKVGFDAYGFPLEVNKEGECLLDIWYNDHISEHEGGPITIGCITIENPDTITIRKFNKKFIRNIDALEVVNYLHNEWDEYRDDNRDARFHPNTLLAVDYAIASNAQLIKNDLQRVKRESKIEKMEEEARDDNYQDITKSYRSYTYKISSEQRHPKIGDIYDREVKTDPRIRRPEDLTPAFDKRAYGKKFEYVGRKFYWVPIIVTKDRIDMKEPTISTRGLSMYILNRIRNQIKEVESMVYAHEQIMKKTPFDYGPREFPAPGYQSLGKYKPFEQDFQL